MGVLQIVVIKKGKLISVFSNGGLHYFRSTLLIKTTKNLGNNLLKIFKGIKELKREYAAARLHSRKKAGTWGISRG